MIFKKKILTLLLASILGFSIAGCTSGAEENKEEPKEKEEVITETSEEGATQINFKTPVVLVDEDVVKISIKGIEEFNEYGGINFIVENKSDQNIIVQVSKTLIDDSEVYTFFSQDLEPKKTSVSRMRIDEVTSMAGIGTKFETTFRVINDKYELLGEYGATVDLTPLNNLIED